MSNGLFLLTCKKTRPNREGGDQILTISCPMVINAVKHCQRTVKRGQPGVKRVQH